MIKTTWLRRLTVLLMTAASVLAFAQQAAPATQAYPTKPVRIIVPYAPGGGADFIARVLADSLSKSWNEAVVVENRPGASGAIATSAVARAAPDGYTLLLGNTVLIQAPAMQSNLPYDVFKDLSPVAQVVSIDDVLMVSSNIPSKSVKELAALVKANPTRYGYGSYGNGTSSHLHGALLNLEMGSDLVHVPYAGSGPLITALLGGQVAMGFVDVSGARAHLESPKIRVLATTGATRSKLLPNIPTMTELGFRNFEPSGFAGVLAPARTPQAIVEKIAADIDKAVKAPEVAKRLLDAGLQPVGGTAEQFSAAMARDAKVWADIAHRAHIRIE